MGAEKFMLSSQDKDKIAQMAYGENASEDDDTIKMTIQSVYNRLRSPRKKEFGKNINEVLKKGYYAVSKNSPMYKQATSGQFPDISSKAKYATIRKQIEAIEGDQDFGTVQFFHTPEEEAKKRKAKTFDYNAVKSTGRVGKYNTYGYNEKPKITAPVTKKTLPEIDFGSTFAQAKKQGLKEFTYKGKRYTTKTK